MSSFAPMPFRRTNPSGGTRRPGDFIPSGGWGGLPAPVEKMQPQVDPSIVEAPRMAPPPPMMSGGFGGPQMPPPRPMPQRGMPPHRRF